MNWIDAAAFGIIALLAFLGLRRGIIDIVVILSAYAAGLIAAVFLYTHLGKLISSHAGIPQTFSRVIAFAGAFLITAVCVRAAGWLLKKIVRLALPGIDKICGLVFGLLLGFIIVVMGSMFLYRSPLNSHAGKLYDGSFTPGFIMNSLEKLSSEKPKGDEKPHPPGTSGLNIILPKEKSD